jgi:hypothetical protein
VLSEHEQRLWDGIVRDNETEADEELPAGVIGGGWSAVTLVLFGMPEAGVILGAATGLVWLLWRFLARPNCSRAAEERPARPGDRTPSGAGTASPTLTRRGTRTWQRPVRRSAAR